MLSRCSRPNQAAAAAPLSRALRSSVFSAALGPHAGSFLRTRPRKKSRLLPSGCSSYRSPAASVACGRDGGTPLGGVGRRGWGSAARGAPQQTSGHSARPAD